MVSWLQKKLIKLEQHTRRRKQETLIGMRIIEIIDLKILYYIMGIQCSKRKEKPPLQ
jgi:hypothetical protein